MNSARIRKTPISSRRTILLGGMLTALGLSGCGGGGAKTKVTETSTTTGQQLIDLKAAYDKGIITKDQYDKQKKKILDQKL